MPTPDIAVIRSSRRKNNAFIRVTPHGTVEIRVPRHASTLHVDLLLKKHSDWIEEQLRLLSGLRLSFVSEEKIQYLGKELRLEVHENSSKVLFCMQDNHTLCVNTPVFPNDEERIATLTDKLIGWYKTQAKRYILPRAHDYASHLQVEIRSIRIKDTLTRWGSCSSKYNLNFSWRLIMTPRPVIDYVIAHEVCHLIHKNHSQEFWNLVKTFDDDYKTHKKWLKEKGTSLFAL